MALRLSRIMSLIVCRLIVYICLYCKQFMVDIQKQLGNRIRELRIKKGFSQEKLSFKCNLHRTYISDIERGSRNVSLKNIKIIASALDVSMSEIFKNL